MARALGTGALTWWLGSLSCQEAWAEAAPLQAGPQDELGTPRAVSSHWLCQGCGFSNGVLGPEWPSGELPRLWLQALKAGGAI